MLGIFGTWHMQWTLSVYALCSHGTRWSLGRTGVWLEVSFKVFQPIENGDTSWAVADRDLCNLLFTPHWSQPFSPEAGMIIVCVGGKKWTMLPTNPLNAVEGTIITEAHGEQTSDDNTWTCPHVKAVSHTQLHPQRFFLLTAFASQPVSDTDWQQPAAKTTTAAMVLGVVTWAEHCILSGLDKGPICFLPIPNTEPSPSQNSFLSKKWKNSMLNSSTFSRNLMCLASETTKWAMLRVFGFLLLSARASIQCSTLPATSNIHCICLRPRRPSFWSQISRLLEKVQRIHFSTLVCSWSVVLHRNSAWPVEYNHEMW